MSQSTSRTSEPIAIVGGGPVGLTLALLLAARNVRSIVVDARPLADALREKRLLALSRGSLQTLMRTIALPTARMAPIRRVVITSAGEFGRAVLDAEDVGSRNEPLGATIRYGDLLQPLSAAADADQRIEVLRPWRLCRVQQSPQRAELQTDDGAPIVSPLLVHAEGTVAGGEARQSAVVAEVRVDGLPAATAIERFTRDGPLALLPLAGSTEMALIWCMDQSAAATRAALDDRDFIAQLNEALGRRTARVVGSGPRSVVPLVEHVRDELRAHRQIYLGNAAQTLHPVAGQGLNLGLRDCAALADLLAHAAADGIDPLGVAADYERARRFDRQSLVMLTRATPGLFATRFAPLALARTMALTAIATVPQLRRQFAQLMMFGVRS